MDAATRRRIDLLVGRVLEAAESAENRRRRAARPSITFAFEEPVAGTIIHDLDVERFYAEGPYFVEQVLSQKLWRWDTFPDDGTPIEPSVPASLGFYPDYTYAGMGLRWDARGVPQIQEDHPLRRNPDLHLLDGVDVERGGWMPRALGWHEEIRTIVGGRLETPFAAIWGRGCLDLAVQLRGYETFLADTAERPAFAHGLLDRLAELRCRWWEAHARHTATAIEPASLADDWINVPFISPGIFRDFVLPPYLAIERFHGGIASIHSCGNQAPVQRYLLEIRSLPQLEVSAWTPLEETLANVPADKKLVVSLHPNDVLCATPGEMEAKLRGITGKCRGRDIAIGTSGLTPLSSDIRAFEDRVRTWTRIARRVQEEEAALPPFADPRRLTGSSRSL
jgi:hypothetical protein